MMAEKEFSDLCENIAINGLLEPIWVYEGRIIDGRNRFNACLRTGIEPRFREWEGEGSLVSFVVSLNLHRRHLSESQRAMLAARLVTVDSVGRPKKPPPLGVIISQGDAAELLNVSKRSVSRSAKVLKDGVLELADMVDSGSVTVARAAEVAELPKGKQKRLIKSGRLSGRKLLNKLKIDVLKRNEQTGTGCLACDPSAEITAESLTAFMLALSAKAPAYARFFEDIVEELEGEKISEQTRANYDRVLEAIDAGYSEKSDLQRALSMNRDEFNHTIAVMLDYRMIEAFQQGGKTDQARGAAKIIYRRVEKIPDEPLPELEYVEMEFD